MDNSSLKSTKVYWGPLGLIASIKILIHVTTNLLSEFGLHRDEYLYLSESDHLAWGYMEVPPAISVIGWLSRGLFGDTLFAVKVFPVLVGVMTIFLLGIFIKELGGGRSAQIIGATSFLLSPAFLGSNGLFQPVSFNQFFWFLTAFALLKTLNYRESNQNDSIKHWLALGVIFGLGILTKYSIAFFLIAIFVGMLFTKHRGVFLTKYSYIAALIALVIAAPNLWWQYSHDFPIIRHMANLRATQLVNVTWQSYFSSQFIFHLLGSIIWLAGLIYGLRRKAHPTLKMFSIAFLATIVLLFVMSGKAYYTVGAYTMMFGLGGIALERWIGQKALLIIPIMIFIHAFVIPISLPILPVKEMETYSKFVQNIFQFVEPFRWEDGEVRTMRQDYADMLGWDEIPLKVAEIYHSLSEDEKKNCLIWGGSYGHAGVLNFYREEFELPQCHSFNASFVAWVPLDLDIKAQIQVEDSYMDPSPYFEQTILMDSIENPLARDPGYIYLKVGPKEDLRPIWNEIVNEERMAAGYKALPVSD